MSDIDYDRLYEVFTQLSTDDIQKLVLTHPMIVGCHLITWDDLQGMAKDAKQKVIKMEHKSKADEYDAQL